MKQKLSSSINQKSTQNTFFYRINRESTFTIYVATVFGSKSKSTYCPKPQIGNSPYNSNSSISVSQCLTTHSPYLQFLSHTCFFTTKDFTKCS